MVVSALRNRNYRMWLLGLSVANIGTWMQRIAQDWLVLELTDGSGTALGLVTAVQFLPVLLFGPFSGVLADRYPKRWTLLWTQVVGGVCGLVLAALVLTGTAVVWHVMVIAVALGLASAVFQPTVQAFVLELVTREEVPAVVGISGGSFHAARLVGPGVAGLMIAAWDTGPVFAVAGLTVIFPIIALLRMDPAKLYPSPPVAAGKGLFMEGVRYAVRQPEILLTLAVTGFIGTFAANSAVTNALMATNVFHMGAKEFGLLGSIMAVGSLAAAALAARRKSVGPNTVVLTAIGFACFNIVASVMPAYGFFAVALVPVALFQITFIITANSSLQLGAEPQLRGRVMALFSVLMMGTTPIGASLVGWAAEQFGVRVAYGGSSVIALVGVLTCVALIGRRVRQAPRAADDKELVKA